MNITVRSTALAQELRLMVKIIPSKASNPVLNYVHLFTTDNGLTLEATNIAITMRSMCASLATKSGAILLPMKKLLELLERLPDMDVTIEVVDHHAIITAGTFKSRMQSMQARDFPTLPTVEGESLGLPAVALCHMIAHSAYAISEKADRYVIDGVLLSMRDDGMAMIATDGKRLTVTTAHKTEVPAPVFVLIPKQTIEILPTFLPDGDLEFIDGKNHLFFKVGARTLISRVIDGKFANYQRIIPQDCDKHIRVDRDALIAALRRVLVMADEESEVVDFTAEPDRMRLSSRSNKFGDADDGVQANYDGETIRVSANGKHVLDFLDRATDKTVMVGMKTATSPMLWMNGTDGLAKTDFLNVILVRKP